MLLAGTKTNVRGFGWQHLNELLNDPEIDAIVAEGLSERERVLIEYCTRVAYSWDHGNESAYSGSGANIACCLTNKFFKNGYDYGSPYTTHDDCDCAACQLVRRHNAELNSPFNCRVCGRRDKSTNRKPSAEQWICEKCISERKQ